MKLENLDFAKKYCNFAAGPGGCAIKICFSTIEGLHIGFNCGEGTLLCQNSYGYKLLIVCFWLVFPPAQEDTKAKNCFDTSEGLLIGFNCASDI